MFPASGTGNIALFFNDIILAKQSIDDTRLGCIMNCDNGSSRFEGGWCDRQLWLRKCKPEKCNVVFWEEVEKQLDCTF